MNKKQFDYDEALEKLKTGKPITGEDGVFTPLLPPVYESQFPASLSRSNLLPI